jgi:uncharacterized SAM-binding protein YcdF (DUF218 family)
MSPVAPPATSQNRHSSGYWLGRVGLALAAALVLFLAITSIRIARQAMRDETRPAGAIIVFGAAEYAGRPSPVFRARLDHAYDLYKGGIARIVITTGGSGYDPVFTEGGVGRDYLIARGIPDQNMIAETQSDDTAESAQRTAAIMRANHISDAVAVSDAYHVFRIKQLMNAQGIHVYAAPRPGSLPRGVWARTFGVLREAVSYTLWKLGIT